MLVLLLGVGFVSVGFFGVCFGLFVGVLLLVVLVLFVVVVGTGVDVGGGVVVGGGDGVDVVVVVVVVADGGGVDVVVVFVVSAVFLVLLLVLLLLVELLYCPLQWPFPGWCLPRENVCLGDDCHAPSGQTNTCVNIRSIFPQTLFAGSKYDDYESQVYLKFI